VSTPVLVVPQQQRRGTLSWRAEQTFEMLLTPFIGKPMRLSWPAAGHSRTCEPRAAVFDWLRGTGDGNPDDVDDIPFGGATGGGVLTRESLREARRNMPPVAAWEERLQTAANSVGGMLPSRAVATLQKVISDAYSAGVTASSPQMRATSALLSALEIAAKEEGISSDAPADPHAAKFESLFADEYAVDLD